MSRQEEDIRAANITRANFLDEGGDPKRCPLYFPVESTVFPEPREPGSDELERLRRQVGDLHHEVVVLRELVEPLLRRTYSNRPKSSSGPVPKPGALLGG